MDISAIKQVVAAGGILVSEELEGAETMYSLQIFNPEPEPGVEDADTEGYWAWVDHLSAEQFHQLLEWEQLVMIQHVRFSDFSRGTVQHRYKYQYGYRDFYDPLYII